ncbi:MAG: EAL domain-containing protein [Burkholderiaceae bacterium]|nr:EAL domain-containing protein [Burkholderiaceae bacterium]
MGSSVIPLRQAAVERSLRQAAFEHAAVPILCVSTSGQILALNAEASALFPSDSLVGRSVAELLSYSTHTAFARRWTRLWLRASRADNARVEAKLPLRTGRRLVASIAMRIFRFEQEEFATLVLTETHDARAAARETRAEEARARALAEHQSELSVVLNADRRVVYASAALESITGEQEKDVLGSPFEFILDQPSRIEFRRAVDRLLREPAGDRQPTQLHLRTRAALAGNGRSISCLLANRLDDPNVRGLVLTARDLGPAERAQARRLRFRERLLELAIQPKSDFVQSLSIILRTAAEVLDVSSASFWRFGREPDVLRCESLFDRASDRFMRDWVGREFTSTRFPAYFAPLLGRQPVIVNDTRTSRLTTMFAGDPEWSHVRSLLDVPVLVEGEVAGVLCLRHRDTRFWDEDDVSFANTTALMLALAIEAAQRQEAETRIEHLAWYDGLTGLPNRNLLRETMRDMIMTAANRKRRMAVMLIDLDRFKDVNDTLGHLVGDALIKSAAEQLRQTVGDGGVVARLGGDEFVVLIGEFVHRQEVALLAARVAQALHRTDLVPHIDTQVSASIGVALFPEHGRDMSTLLKNADAAMYQAKRDGRNQFSFFNPIRYERAAREVQLGIELVKALQSDCPQFICEYQPQIEMMSGRVVGLEALIRWDHPVHGILTPDRFIGVAEISGLSERITRWVLNEVCSQINRWRRVRPDFDVPVSINVAGREMGSTVLPTLVRSALAKHDVDPHLVVLEITERTLVKDSEINNDVLAELAALGVGLVLDDFGTGYSMMGYLKRMPITALKIDQSFIEGIPGDPDSRAIVHAMLAVARHFKLKVVAEGVESLEQVQYMREIGCEFAQGFFYSRSLSADTILDYLERSGT